MSGRKSKKRNGRGRVSSIDLLPEELRVRLTTALREKRLTQTDITRQLNELLDKQGLQPVSRSAVGRYSQKIEAKLEQQRRVTEAAEALTSGMEDTAKKSDVGRALTQVIKNMAMDLVMEFDGEKDPDKLLARVTKLANITERIERASSMGAKREMDVHRFVESEFKQKAVDAIDVAAREKGLSGELVDELKVKMLGLKVSSKNPG